VATPGTRSPASVAARADAARADIAGSLERAAEEIRGAVTDYDEYLEAFTDEG
jgi:hypothetical protein